MVDRQYVCTSKINIAAKIADILSSLNKEKMLATASENYYEAQKYDVVLLRSKRKGFLDDFRDGEKR